MHKITKVKISANTKIKKAMQIISEGTFKIAIAVDKTNKLIGTLSDGDIRKGFLSGLNMDSTVESIIFRKPITAKINDNLENIAKIALPNQIYQIPVIDDNRKVIGLHIFNKFINFKNKQNKVIIMAGGKGMRLRPLTKDIPKPMLKVGDKPILQILIEKFKESGFRDFTICVNYKSNIIKDHFGDGKNYGVEINYINEKKKNGYCWSP